LFACIIRNIAAGNQTKSEINVFKKEVIVLPTTGHGRANGRLSKGKTKADMM
jgi:hypothetical protein